VTSGLDQHLASYPCTAAGSRALIFHLRDDHGKTLFTSPFEEDHAVHSAMHAAAHEAEQREPLCTCRAFHRPHPHHGPAASAGSEPGEDGGAGDADGHKHDWACASPQHGPDAAYRCRCGQTATGAEIGVTEQARDWFYAPAGQRQARVTTRGRLPSQLGRRAGPGPAPARRRVPVGGHRPRRPRRGRPPRRVERDRGPGIRPEPAARLVTPADAGRWPAQGRRLPQPPECTQIPASANAIP
jgi:hypothetical protein